MRGRVGAIPAADGVGRRCTFQRALRAPAPEPVPRPERDLPGATPGRPPAPHYTQPPPGGDVLASLARLGEPAACEPPVPRAVPIAPLSSAQPRIHGEGARLLPRPARQGPLRLPPRPGVLLGRVRCRARNPRSPRRARRRWGTTTR